MKLSSLLLPAALLLRPTLSAALSIKAQRWAHKAASSPDHVAQLDTASFEDLTNNKDRDYSVTVLLTALDSGFKCAPCKEFDPSYRAVASSWGRLPKDVRSKHIFASLDFQQGQEVYKKFGLTSAPTVFYFKPTEGDRAPEDGKTGPLMYDLGRNGFGPENLLKFHQANIPAEFEIYKPKPWALIISTPIAVIASFRSLYQYRSLFLPIITSKHLWTAVTLLLVIVFNSGYMWNRIRDAPYAQVDRQGRSQWIIGGFQQQVGAETQVVGAMYAGLAFAIVALSNLVPSTRDPGRQRIGVFLWSGVLIVLFSLLMSIFRLKNGGYPFRLLF
ncbi:Oligosaccharyltransferase, gamma subunit [Phaffia rhodozyma]|uniref:Oligosaccharyltransferase, gamma subunit n=1 Tax=Phaffia rhodozyma TaxID=264483 RepID=A0A0F7SRE3_PHARH|nr:Oligosaccharyltransferase, gamma subunit [Phaffia rhodozyma]